MHDVSLKRVFMQGKTDGGSLVQPSRCERHVASNLMNVNLKSNNAS